MTDCEISRLNYATASVVKEQASNTDKDAFNLKSILDTFPYFLCGLHQKIKGEFLPSLAEFTIEEESDR